MKIAIFDIDRCLADTTCWEDIFGSREPFVFHEWFMKNINPKVLAPGKMLFDGAVANDIVPYFITGRENSEFGYNGTKLWLQNSGFWRNESKLLMRSHDDVQRGIITDDAELKLKLFKENVSLSDEVVFACDDRMSIVQMWHNNGIPAILMMDDKSVRR